VLVCLLVCDQHRGFARNCYFLTYSSRLVFCYVHRFGEDAAQVTQETLATAGHVVATAWTISKLRKALNPKEGVKPTKTAMVKGLAKNVIKGK